MSVSSVAWSQSDPTRPLYSVSEKQRAEQQSKNDIVLQSIVKTATNEQLRAVISGQLVKQGDKVFGYQVTRIDGRSVTLKTADSSRKLTLFAQPIVKYKKK
jgi:hypothetical protein